MKKICSNYVWIYIYIYIFVLNIPKRFENKRDFLHKLFLFTCFFCNGWFNLLSKFKLTY